MKRAVAVFEWADRSVRRRALRGERKVNLNARHCAREFCWSLPAEQGGPYGEISVRGDRRSLERSAAQQGKPVDLSSCSVSSMRNSNSDARRRCSGKGLEKGPLGLVQFSSSGACHTEAFALYLCAGGM